MGRLGVISLSSLDAEFVGHANEPWPAGDLPAQPRDIKLCSQVERVHWELAPPMALELWQSVIDHSGISEHFKALARQQLVVVKAFLVVIGRMA